ncbi:MAG: transketolase C-terminal domain-containing protein, partial [Planctomycetota bacterium]
LDTLESQEKKQVEAIQKLAWKDYIEPIQKELREVSEKIRQLAQHSASSEALLRLKQTLEEKEAPFRKDIFESIAQALLWTRTEKTPLRQELSLWKKQHQTLQQERYSSHLHCETEHSALKVPEISPVFSKNSQSMTGFSVLNLCFDAALKRDPRVIAFGEDVGQIGDVNQGFSGLQAKYGKYRVSDTGIRECTIIGQAIGMAMRGLRPIAEIQYLDYLPYALQIISDDLATLHYRTKGLQKAPVIIRTRGHRLEGIWHSGSPMAGILHFIRGLYLLVPRNMTIAAGFYNTLLRSEEPAILVEVLNAYRLKETCPDNIDQFTLPFGVPECLKTGKDITLVTYGACCRIALEASEILNQVGIDVEIIDVQTLIPFDRFGKIKDSLKKTNRILFLDEDVPGGATAYMMQEVLERQGGYSFLDSAPKTLSAKSHRPAYGTDGNYWSKPNREDIFEAIYAMMHESDPTHYPLLDS